MKQEMTKRSVFYVSDRTGKTANYIGQSLLAQFDSIEYEHNTYAFVNSKSDAKWVAEQIKLNAEASGLQPLVFSTLVDAQIEQYIRETKACVISLFTSFTKPLEKSLGVSSSHSIGKAHEEYDHTNYEKGIDAIDFTFKNDDGTRTNEYDQADVILVGVSRCAKTPTCLYLAMHFAIKAANYPLTEDDLTGEQLPAFLLPYVDKIVGLSIRPDQLSAIREKRRPKSAYASLKKCRQEVKQAEHIMRNHELSIFDSTSMSIEEIAVNIVKDLGFFKHP